MLLDFDPLVTGIASQPFRLSWQGLEGNRLRHTPDFFARLVDGTGVVIDVRPDQRIKDRDAVKFAVMHAACVSVGWRYLRVGEPDGVLMANVRWLAGYRHRRVYRKEVADRLVSVFADGTGLLEGAREAGDQIAVLPVLYHLLWRGILATDLQAGLLSASSAVELGASQEGGKDADAASALAGG